MKNLQTTNHSSNNSASNVLDPKAINIPLENQVAAGVIEQFNKQSANNLASDLSPFGRMLEGHITRQIQMIDQYHEMFVSLGMEPNIIKAAVYASDMTKFLPLEESLKYVKSAVDSKRIVTLNPSFTQEQLDRASDLALNSPNSPDAIMTNLYLHSIAGAEKAFQELSAAFELGGIARDRAEERALEIVKHQVGHDSFASGREGFGARFLLPKMKQVLGGEPEYPTPITAEGYLVEILDRVEATLVPTTIRYLTELAARSVPNDIRNNAGPNIAAIAQIYEFEPQKFAQLILQDTWGNMRQLERIDRSITAEIASQISAIDRAMTVPQDAPNEFQLKEERSSLQGILSSPLLNRFEESISRMGKMYQDLGIREVEPTSIPVTGFQHEGAPLTNVMQLQRLLENYARVQ